MDSLVRDNGALFADPKIQKDPKHVKELSKPLAKYVEIFAKPIESVKQPAN